MPNGEQSRIMRRYAGACRFVYNKALAWHNEQYAADESFKFGYTKLANLLPKWKNDQTTAWLKESPSQTLQQALKNLEISFRNFFAKRANFPKFKKRGQGDSFRYPQGFKVEQGNNRIFLPKLGWIHYRNSRVILGKIKNITISEITIELKTDEKFNHLMVRDTATGIPKEFLAKIFDQFETKKSMSGGTGLGLAFCKMVMESYGGNIVCNSELGKYTEFVLSFPKSKLAK